MTDEEFKAEAQKYSLRRFEKMLTKRNYYSICEVISHLSDMGCTSYVNNEEYKSLLQYHCRNWDTMSEELQEELINRTRCFVAKQIALSESKEKNWFQRLFS